MNIYGYEDLGLTKNHKDRINKILLPVLEDYSYYKKDLNRGHNSLIRSQFNKDNLKLTPFTSLEIDPIKRNNKLNLKEYDSMLEKRIKYNKLKFSIDELQYKVNRNNLKKEILKEKIFAHNNLFFHPQLSQFMIHPSKIYQLENQYNFVKTHNNPDELVELGKNPYEDKDEIEVGKPVYYEKQIVIKKVYKKKKKEVVKKKDSPKISIKTLSSIKIIDKYHNDEIHRRKIMSRFRAGVNILLYYFVHKDLSANRNKRNMEMESHRLQLRPDQKSLIQWFRDTQTSFINELMVYPNLDLSFNNFSGSIKLQEQSEKIMSLLNLLMRNLLRASTEGKHIPEGVISSLKPYCSNNVYLAKMLLTTYEIFRLDFALNGSIINQNEHTSAMLVIFFVFTKTFINRILNKILDHYKEFKNYKYITLSMKFLSSILQYLIEELFDLNPIKKQNILIYLNYLKNYKEKKPNVIKLEGSDIIKNNAIEYNDWCEFNFNLVPKDAISDFFVLNREKLDEFKQILLQWGIKISDYVKKRIKVENYKKRGE